ncbi:hypothetical protein ES288_A13G163300v1, partial [Gossypium darwinii]
PFPKNYNVFAILDHSLLFPQTTSIRISAPSFSGSATLWTVISPTRSMIWAHAYTKEILQKQFGGITRKQCVVSSSTIDVRGVLLWAPPRPGFVKFNVDGIAKGCPRLTRCGGVLQNEMGETSALFSGPCLPRRLLQLKF